MVGEAPVSTSNWMGWNLLPAETSTVVLMGVAELRVLISASPSVTALDVLGLEAPFCRQAAAKWPRRWQLEHSLSKAGHIALGWSFFRPQPMQRLGVGVRDWGRWVGGDWGRGFGGRVLRLEAGVDVGRGPPWILWRGRWAMSDASLVAISDARIFSRHLSRSGLGMARRSRCRSLSWQPATSCSRRCWEGSA